MNIICRIQPGCYDSVFPTTIPLVPTIGDTAEIRFPDKSVRNVTITEMRIYGAGAHPSMEEPHVWLRVRVEKTSLGL